MAPNKPSNPPEAIVVGAGPAGLAFAARYSEGGGKVTVFESSNDVGGLARSFPLWGANVDLGPHRFFSADPVVNGFWHQHVSGQHVMVDRKTRIFYQSKFFDYPLKAGNALRQLGLLRAIQSLLSYMRAKAFGLQEDGSLERWVAARFGWRLYRTFFKTYTEKVWGIPCSQIDADWAAQRIMGLTLWGAVKNALTSGKRNSLKTLVDQFAYPIDGNGFFYQQQKKAILQNGGQIRLSSPVNRVLVDKGVAYGVELSDGEVHRADAVISSMPLTTLVTGIEGVPSEVLDASSKLNFRNTILVYLRVEATDIFPDQWLYVHDPALLHGRITNFNNWSPGTRASGEQTILCLEFWCFDDDAIWSEKDETIIALARRELAATGLVEDQLISEGHVIRVGKSYPVYQRGYQQPLAIVEHYVDSIRGLTAIGRYGSFKYNNQDHSILMGILAADGLLSGEVPALWHVNTDSNYQEAADISALKSTQE